MAKDNFRWEPEMVERMATDEIEARMKALVPGFDLGEFAARAEHYISCEDLAEEEFCPLDAISDIDEDFIFIACEELWKRLIPDRPAVEHLGELIDDNIEEIAGAEERGEWDRVEQLSTETFELIYKHIIEQRPAGYRVKHEFYEKLQGSALYDIEIFINTHLVLLHLCEEHNRVIELAEILSKAFEDDTFQDHKAQSLFALGRREEGEDCYREIISRNPDNIWLPVLAGDCFLQYGEKDFEKAKSYYALAFDAARKTPDSPEGREDLYAVYERVINLAREMGEMDRADRLQRMLDSLRELSSDGTPATEGKVGRNDPCPCGSGKKYKKCCGQNASQPQQALPFDQRLMERNLLAINQVVAGQDFGSIEEMNRYINDELKGGSALAWVPGTPLEKAQGLVFQALETSGKAKRLQLAHQALEVCPDCADAYVLLAEEKARNMEEVRRFYEAGVRAGERALGEERFQKEAGHFWGIVDTRPYMRARNGLAQCLWQMGKRDEAVGHYRDMLRLNPNDNQGIRYLMASGLLEMGEIDALEELLGQYDEPTAAWLYTRALTAFLRESDVLDALHCLQDALEHNRHVPAYILGEKKMPGKIPERIGFGDKSEAVAYAAEFGMGWHRTRGAIHWLKSVCRDEQAIRKDVPGATDVPEVFIQAFETKNEVDNPRQAGKQGAVEIYTFNVSLKGSPKVWRRIEVKGNQNLNHLHEAIFEAFERYDEHLYAFFMSNKPGDGSSEYGIPYPERKTKSARRARIDSLALKPKQKFLYLFDFGDEWWHSVQLLDIRREEGKGKYPRIIESQGEAPPQYDDE